MDTTLARVPIGQLLDGRYRVESHLAHGGMATVYLGTDTRLDRTVALKIMHAELANDEDFVRRFVAEARSVAKLSHPNVVAVYDQGADGRTLYLAMEYVPGRTLRDRKSTRLNSSHVEISYAVFCLKKKKKTQKQPLNKLEGNNLKILIVKYTYSIIYMHKLYISCHHY